MAETPHSLLERARDRGDGEAWRRLAGLYTPMIAGWLRRQSVPPDAAEDVAQEVLAVVARELPGFRHNHRVGAFRAWLRAITTNCLRASRRQARPLAVDLDTLADQLADPAGGLGDLWDREHDLHVARRLLELVEPEFAPATWDAFRLQVVEGWPAAAVAAELGKSVNAVLIAKSKVLKRLREYGRGLVD